MSRGERGPVARPYVVGWLVLMLLTGSASSAPISTSGSLTRWWSSASPRPRRRSSLSCSCGCKAQPSLKWLFAGAGFFWLLFLYGLSITDYATRRGWPRR